MMTDDVAIIKTALDTTQKSVLFTLIHVEGSAYQKEGAIMLVQEDGTAIGLISGGCLESDLVARAERLMANTTAFNNGDIETITYDLKAEDEQLWGIGAGCNATIYVSMEPVTSSLICQLEKIITYLEKGIPVLEFKIYTHAFSHITTCYTSGDGEQFGNWERYDLLNEVWQHNQLRIMKSGMLQVPSYKGRVYLGKHVPKPRLIVIGAGPDAHPLVAYAAHAGFDVTVADWREALCHPRFFPDAQSFVIERPISLIDTLKLTRDDYVVVMTHQFQHDQIFMHVLINLDLSYLGILGSRRRTKRLLDCDTLPDNLHSPVGLPIGAEGPEEIAISIVAELIQNRRQSEGG